MNKWMSKCQDKYIVVQPIGMRWKAEREKGERGSIWWRYSSPFSDLVHLRPASPLDNCPSQTSQPNRPVTGPKPTGRSICCTHLWPTGQTVLYPSWTDWPVCIVPIMNWLASPVLNMNLIVDWPASCVLYPSLTDWLVLCCIHLWLTGRSCVVSIFDWRAGLVLYPSLTDRPVVCCIHLWLTGR